MQWLKFKAERIQDEDMTDIFIINNYYSIIVNNVTEFYDVCPNVAVKLN